MNSDSAALQEKLAAYNFYHCIPLNSELKTPGWSEFIPLQTPVTRALEQLSIKGKRVLDIGCRDGLFSLQAESMGATEVIGIDNDLSRGAVEVVLPHLKSNVRMYELNVYDLTPETFGKFDIVLFPGVLYHLRYPMWGLKRIRDVMQPEAWLIIETAIFRGHEDLSLLYCPIDEESPYEPTSVSFFNTKGLRDTLFSLGISVMSFSLLGISEHIDRGTFVCQFQPDMVHPGQHSYWERNHKIHANFSPESASQLLAEKSELLYRKKKVEGVVNKIL